MGIYMQDIRTENFENVTVLGHPMLFTNMRCDRSTLPEGLYLYEVRDDECSGTPCEIADHIMVNHWGTIITNEPIEYDFPKNDNVDPYCRLLSDDDWNYEGTMNTVFEYMERYSAKTS